MTQYGQFCPVAKAMELLDERWTMLIVRELIAGSRTLRRPAARRPKMSPTLLSTRLRTLSRAGVIDRHEQGKRVYYTLTEAGRELQPVVESIGKWGIRWMPELGDEDYDPHLLMWDVQRNVDVSALPPGRTVLQFSFRDVPPGQRDWWLVLQRGSGGSLRLRPRPPCRRADRHRRFRSSCACGAATSSGRRHSGPGSSPSTARAACSEISRTG